MVPGPWSGKSSREEDKMARAKQRGSLQAFMLQDLELARSIPAKDEETDSLYQQVYCEPLTFIMEDPGNIEQANLLLGVAHDLERTADRMINLCERIVLPVAGEMVELASDDSGVESIG